MPVTVPENITLSASENESSIVLSAAQLHADAIEELIVIKSILIKTKIILYI
ncbi:MAG: hypothetical protein NPMRD1_310001 [Nitrosopumilales archaeon]|nr:MAG: hypothetical protein NPMRD1_310001 [Nitrosopumilales archaeon]